MVHDIYVPLKRAGGIRHVVNSKNYIFGKTTRRTIKIMLLITDMFSILWFGLSVLSENLNYNYALESTISLLPVSCIEC